MCTTKWVLFSSVLWRLLIHSCTVLSGTSLFWYQKISNIRNQVIEKGFSDFQWKQYVLWEWINLKEETYVKLIYWLIDNNTGLFIIIHFPVFIDHIFSAVGVVSPRYVFWTFFPFQKYLSYIPQEFCFEYFVASFWKYTPLSFFRAPMYGFLLLHKANKWSNRLWGGHWQFEYQ